MRNFINMLNRDTDIKDIIDTEIAKTGMEAIEINDGFCDFIADNIVKKLGGPTATTFVACPRDELDCERVNQTYDPTAPLHYFVCWEGRVYDAEAPMGVDRWQDLPFYKRHRW